MEEKKKEELIRIWDGFLRELAKADEKAEQAENLAIERGTEKARKRAEELRNEAESRVIITNELQMAFDSILYAFGYQIIKDDCDQIVDIVPIK